ncbi:hypothetical protein A2X44_01175 [candidate division CPR3 bacterium GWF2_35_18]|uniref:Stage II sporulation protein M n=1 Tax=candidate division CPR3 bacterium GW2011_GWF2_35_18 TaxID=1618350 RepID=A0A0G0E4N6_UNCC3|nr:MAG: hypothetical protein UR67_C0001G0214 [candidate division CPR3 bacterium GW2011_GWF2_35_18]KKP86447.1 MAG: hypothetical protein UR87_C0019G0006 [candidate division CPR3 bacterium GW2011_GWE2_35_7]OGB63514.1 MAG: hypothetical protein A2X44_01175 [candidate division CPR3 bacterium GWF2_35_18]OGB64741.1 MAG: hypothetical protein A2250_04850 [candidate division CPR3 bacterium RIFOXYA2_FULL_35_13]OGB76058.1 MAG: hypothetical protein A2476_00650 [candidate division CPR3 bacterium RIFOXYC2_FULL
MIEKIKLYLKNNKKWLLISSSVFGIGFLLGFVIVLIFPQILTIIIKFFQQVLSKEIESLASQNDIQSVYLIFTRNFKAALVFSFGGIFFGFLTLTGLFFNGFILGVVVGGVILSGQFLVVMATVLPHGIVEIPAIILSGAWGFRLGLDWILDSSKGKRGLVFWSNFKNLLKFVPIMFLLLFIAACIEVFVSGKLAMLF